MFVGAECPDGLIPYETLRSGGSSVSRDRIDELEAEVGLDAVINMQYTSGTTAYPKGVMLSNRNIVNNGYWIGRGLAFSPRDRLCL